MEESIREKLKHWLEHGMIFLKWVACALLMGLVLGAAGTLFHYCVDGANRYSGQYPYLIWFLPLGGLLIVFLIKFENGAGSGNRSGDSVGPLHRTDFY